MTRRKMVSERLIRWNETTRRILTSRNSILLLLVDKFVNIPEPITRALLQAIHAVVHNTQLFRALRQLLLHVRPIPLVLLTHSSSIARTASAPCSTALSVVRLRLGEHALARRSIGPAD